MEYLNDKDLSWEAKGMLTYILNQSPMFSLNKKYFYSNFAGGRRKVDAIFKELKDKGYMNGDVQNVQQIVQNVQRTPVSSDVQNVQHDVQNVQQDVQNVQLLYNIPTPYSPPSTKTSQPKDEVYEAMLRWVNSDDELKDSFNDFLNNRLEQGDKMMVARKKALLKDLQQLSHGDLRLATKIVRKSLKHNWKSFYKLKKDDLQEDVATNLKKRNNNRL